MRRRSSTRGSDTDPATATSAAHPEWTRKPSARSDGESLRIGSILLCMPTRILVAAALFACSALPQAPKPNTNYDESKVGTYTLPDPLLLANGQRVRDAKTWVEKRRPEIFRVIESEFFGRSPERPKGLHWEVTETGRAYDGKAIRKQVAIYFSAKKDGPRETVLIYLPTDAKGPVPLFLAINFTGNQHVSADPVIELPLVWNRERTARERAPEASRSS